MIYDPKTDVLTYNFKNEKIFIKPNGDCFKWIPPKEITEKEFCEMIGASQGIKNEYMLQYDRKKERMFYEEKKKKNI
jgi:hypothetical protein